MADGSVMRLLKILETMPDFVLSLSGPKESFFISIYEIYYDLVIMM